MLGNCTKQIPLDHSFSKKEELKFSKLSSALVPIFTILIAISRLLAGQASPGWQQQWEKLVQGAKKEGQVTVYVHSGYAPVLTSGAFEKAFPEIKLTVVSGVENDLERRFSAERRAEKYLADVFMVGVLRSNDFKQAKYLDPIRPVLLLPEVIDESKWWQGRHYYMDPERQYLFRYVASAQIGQISYNTELVQPKEFTSFWDFLNPKWKGRILSRDIRLPGTGGSAMRLFYFSPDMGPDYIRKLFGETDITLFRDRRQGLDWLAAGKFAICFWCEGVEKGNTQGLPVDMFGRMKEGAGLSAGRFLLLSIRRRTPMPRGFSSIGSCRAKASSIFNARSAKPMKARRTLCASTFQRMMSIPEAGASMASSTSIPSNGRR